MAAETTLSRLQARDQAILRWLYSRSHLDRHSGSIRSLESACKALAETGLSAARCSRS